VDVGGASRYRGGVRLAFFSLLFFLTACAPSVTAGIPCLYNSDCPEPYACVDGRCGSECTVHRDCPEGRCVFPAPEVGRCFLDAVPQCASSPCPGALTCFEQRCYGGCADCPSDGACVDGRCERAGARDAGAGD
jgi:hypothetical protein